MTQLYPYFLQDSHPFGPHSPVNHTLSDIPSTGQSLLAANKYGCWCRSTVYVCSVLGDIVLLDIAQDKYLSVPPRAALALAIAVPGWPQHLTDEHPDKITEAEVRKIVAFYVAKGVLTENLGEGRSAQPIAYPPPKDCVVLGFDPDLSPRLRLREMRRVAFSSIVAVMKWRMRSLEFIVREVAIQKSQASSRDFDPSRAADLCCIYRQLQALVFTGRDRCFLQALAFGLFLAHYGIFPDWVFGVRSRPFAAHCWLQHGLYLLNETPEGIKLFTPIFSA